MIKEEFDYIKLKEEYDKAKIIFIKLSKMKC
jgi:hypothetical protein